MEVNGQLHAVATLPVWEGPLQAVELRKMLLGIKIHFSPLAHSLVTVMFYVLKHGPLRAYI